MVSYVRLVSSARASKQGWEEAVFFVKFSVRALQSEHKSCITALVGRCLGGSMIGMEWKLRILRCVLITLKGYLGL